MSQTYYYDHLLTNLPIGNLFFAKLVNFFSDIFWKFFFWCTMGKQVVHSYLAYSALWASRWLTAILHTVHYGQAGGKQLFCIQCTLGKQVIQLFHTQCTMGKQVIHSYSIYSALSASKWYIAIQHTVHYGPASCAQLFCIQCTMDKQVVHSYFT